MLSTHETGLYYGLWSLYDNPLPKQIVNKITGAMFAWFFVDKWGPDGLWSLLVNGLFQTLFIMIAFCFKISLKFIYLSLLNNKPHFFTSLWGYVLKNSENKRWHAQFDGMVWKRFMYLWPFMGGSSSVGINQQCEALMFPILLARTSCWKKSNSLEFEISWRLYDVTMMHHNCLIHDWALMCVLLCRIKSTNYKTPYLFGNILSKSNEFSVITLTHYYEETFSTSVNIYFSIIM